MAQDNACPPALDEPGFIRRTTLEAAHARLRTCMDQLAAGQTTREAALRAYDELLALRDRYFPLLLLDGDPLQLRCEPLDVRLLPDLQLPELDGAQRRWLVAYFSPDHTAENGAVQILEWRCSDKQAAVSPLAEQLPFPIAAESAVPVVLDARPLQVQVVHKEEMVTIRLKFKHGEVQIHADQRRGIHTALWLAEAAIDPWVAEDRCNSGEMKGVAWIRSRPGTEDWADDEISLSNDAAPLPVGDNIGRINAADKPQADHPWLYLASENACVYRIDIEHPATPQKRPVTGAVRGVVCVADTVEGYEVLAAAYDGTVFALSFSGDNPRIKYWQYTWRNIQRLLSWHGKWFLLLDRRGKLLPVSLCRLQEHRKIHETATRKLYKQFQQLSARDLVPPSGQALQDEIRLAFERWLLERGWFGAPHNKNKQSPTQPFVLQPNMARWLRWSTAGDSGLDALAFARIRYRLLSRFFTWLSHRCFAKKDFTDRLDELWPLLNLPENAPDSLWLWLLQEQDWVECYLQIIQQQRTKRDLPALPDYLQASSTTWQNHVRSVQQQFIEAAYRHGLPLFPQASQRVSHQVRHIRALDADKNLLILLEYQKNYITVLGIDHARIQVESRLPAKDMGMASTLCVMPPNGEPVYRVLVGTQRGELHLLRLDLADGATSVLAQAKIRASLLCSHYLERQGGFLLSGQDDHGHGVLLRWQPDREPSVLWRSEAAGSLRMMEVDEATGQLWTVDRVGRCLWHFALDALLAHPGQTRPEKWWDAQRELHALSYDPFSRTVVCGGDQGFTLAFNAGSGCLLWSVHSGGNVRRIRHTPAQGGLWMLCGDGRRSLLLSQNPDAGVREILEHDSPVTSLCRWGEQGFIVGTLNGQVALVVEPSAASATPPSLSLDTYAPLRSWPPAGPPRAVLLERLRLRPQFPVQPPILLHTTACAVAALSRQADDELLWREAGAFLLSQEDAGIAAFFFYRTGEHQHAVIDKAVFARHSLTLCAALWDDWSIRPLRPTQGALCKLLSAMLRWLEYLLGRDATEWQTAETKPASQHLLSALQSRVWRLDTVEPQHSGLTTCLTTDVLAAVRLSQVLRHWRQVCPDRNPANLGERLPRYLDAWCRSLTEVWHINEAEALRRRLGSVFRSGLVLAGQHRQKNPWEYWFVQQLLQTEKPAEASPAPLHQLWQPLREPLLNWDEQALLALLPDNPLWAQWLRGLQDCLGRLQSAQTANVAWDERDQWLALRDHFTGTGSGLFTPARGQAWLALCWPWLSEIWRKFVDEALASLRSRVNQAPGAYVDLDWQERWLDAERVLLTLRLRNYHVDALKLQRVRWGTEPPGTTVWESAAGLVLPDMETPPQALELPPIAALGATPRGTLYLDFQCPALNAAFTYTHELILERSIERLFSAPPWQATGRRLSALLKDARPFLWLDGALCSKEKRRDLRQRVDANPLVGFCRNLEAALRADAVAKPLFCPDLSLGASPATLLGQVQELLCPEPGQFSAAALALWGQYRGFPEAVSKALAPGLPTVMGLLERLLGEPVAAGVVDALHALPASALGAWCRGEPVYPELEPAAQAELYIPAPCAFTPALWARLDGPGVPITALAALFEQTPAEAEQQRQQRLALLQHWAWLGQPEGANPAADAVVTALLSRLSPAEPYAADGGWRVDDSASPSRIQLRFTEYRSAYLLPRTGSSTPSARNQTDPALWLYLDDSGLLPKGLPGITLRLSRDNALALLHAPPAESRNSQALFLLNRMALQQKCPEVGDLWRSAVGLGALVDKHFGGRAQELARLHQCLEQADQGRGTSSVLLVGGKRIGKTSLRERLKYEISRSANPQRLVLEAVFLNTPQPAHGAELECWVLQTLLDALHRTRYLGPLAYTKVWCSDVLTRRATLETRCAVLRNTLSAQLRAVGKTSGCMPLLSLDETDHLARADHQNPEQRFRVLLFLRSLVTDGLVCLLATSYPHGAGRAYALNVGNRDSSNPMHNALYNTFSCVLSLGAWEPATTWNYLRDTLAGMGVIVPDRLRQPVLQLTRGIPWLVRELAKYLYDEGKGGNVVRAANWQCARARLRSDLEKELRSSVNAVAAQLDKEHDLNVRDRNSLGNDRLWTALLRLAEQAVLQAEVAEQWEDDMEFGLADLHACLPHTHVNQVAAALEALSGSLLISGVEIAADRFRFAYNLLPAWAAQQQSREYQG